MIKILFFIPSLSGGGAEKVLCNLVNHMDQDQFDITVQTIEEGQPEKYLNQGIRYRSISHCRTGLGKKLFSYWFRLLAELKLIYPFYIKDDYDIEVAYLECDATKVMAASTNKKALKLAWVHCDLEKNDGVAENAARVKKYYDKYDRAICVSEDARNGYVALFGEKPESEVLYNVIDDEEILTKAEESMPAGFQKHRFTIVSVGRLTPQKNYIRLLKTHKKLLDAGIEQDLWILGEGEERQMLEAYIRENHLNDSVVLAGFQKNPYPFIKAADLVVCSSNFEGYSTFVTEAVILGKPIVTTDCAGMHELLGASEYGLITENEDEAFYDGMKKMLTDAELRKHYAEKAAIRGKDFSAREIVRTTEDFMVDLLEKKMNANSERPI